MNTTTRFQWWNDDPWRGPMRMGWRKKNKGACCDWDTLWASFICHWKKKHPTQPRPPDHVVELVRHYWSDYAMTGYEAFATVEQKLNAKSAA